MAQAQPLTEEVAPQIIYKKDLNPCEICSTYIMKDIERNLRKIPAVKAKRTKIQDHFEDQFEEIFRKNIKEQAEDEVIVQPLDPIDAESKKKYEQLAFDSDELLLKVVQMREQYPKNLVKKSNKECENKIKALDDCSIPTHETKRISIPNLNFVFTQGISSKPKTNDSYIEDIEWLREKSITQNQVNEALESDLVNRYISPGKRRVSRRLSSRKPKTVENPSIHGELKGQSENVSSPRSSTRSLRNLKP